MLDDLYDPECETLAEHFLQDEAYAGLTAGVHEDRVRRLAAVIQRAVEDWFATNDGDGEEEA